MTVIDRLAADRGDDPDAIIGKLVGGLALEDQLVLLAAMKSGITRKAEQVMLEKAVTDRLRAALLLIELGLPTQLPVPPPLAVRLSQAAQLCQELAGQVGNDEFWRCILLSLRAECLHLLGRTEESHAAAKDALEAYGCFKGTDPLADARQAYCTYLLQGGDPPATNRMFVAALGELLSRK